MNIARMLARSTNRAPQRPECNGDANTDTSTAATAKTTDTDGPARVTRERDE